MRTFDRVLTSGRIHGCLAETTSGHEKALKLSQFSLKSISAIFFIYLYKWTTATAIILRILQSCERDRYFTNESLDENSYRSVWSMLDVRCCCCVEDGGYGEWCSYFNFYDKHFSDHRKVVAQTEDMCIQWLWAIYPLSASQRIIHVDCGTRICIVGGCERISCGRNGKMNMLGCCELAQISIFQLIFMWWMRARRCVCCACRTEDACWIRRDRICTTTGTTTTSVEHAFISFSAEWNTIHLQIECHQWIKWMRVHAKPGDPFQSAVGRRTSCIVYF